MSLSAFGVDHGEVSKGLPSAVKAGGGGSMGSMLRLKNHAGKSAAKLLGSKAYSESHAGNLKSLARFETGRGQQAKEVVGQQRFNAHMKQYGGGSDSKTSQVSRSIRAGLLNEDGAARRRGYKTGKSSALDRHYRGRVGDMKELP